MGHLLGREPPPGELGAPSKDDNDIDSLFVYIISCPSFSSRSILCVTQVLCALNVLICFALTCLYIYWFLWSMFVSYYHHVCYSLSFVVFILSLLLSLVCVSAPSNKIVFYHLPKKKLQQGPATTTCRNFRNSSSLTLCTLNHIHVSVRALHCT